jgi:predicted aspartyl protease
LVQGTRPCKFITLDKSHSLSLLGLVENVLVKFLVDTGASVTLVSRDIYLSCFSNIELEPVEFNICQADGQKMGILGKKSMELTIGNWKVFHEVIFADMQGEAILGMDFLLEQECKLNIGEAKMVVQGQSIQLCQDNENSSCCKVSLREDILIPPNSEVNINTRVHRKGKEPSLHMLKGTNKFRERYNLVMSESISNIDKGKAIVRIYNPNNHEIQLYEGTNIAITEPIEMVREEFIPASCKKISLEPMKKNYLITWWKW